MRYKKGNLNKKLIILIIGIFTVINIPTINAFAKDENDDIIIDQLFDERLRLISENKNTDSVERKLETYGVERISEKQVKKRYKAAYNSITGNKKNYPLAKISRPNNGDVDWFLHTYKNYKYKKKKKRYNVQVLRAQPNGNPSRLAQKGDLKYKKKGSWKAGGTSFLKAFVDYTVGKSRVLGISKSIYDVASDTISGLKTTTVIKDADVLYSWTLTTTAAFIYVKPKGKNDSFQQLSYISTKCKTSVGWTCGVFITKNGRTYPDNIVGKVYFNSIPKGYNSKKNAVTRYRKMDAKYTAYVQKINIKGIGGKKITDIYPVLPAFPSQVEN